MGRATRWIKSLLTGKKDATASSSPSTYPKEKKRWSFTKSPKETEPTVARPAHTVDWLRSLYAESESKHAIAVAAATAAAADAAVAAAQAAVAVARLTSHAGRGERWAAVKIQTAFRSFLARKALRALKGLVKLQALVRGYLVRKQAAATLHSMQALIRAQATVRMHQQQRRRSRLCHDFRPRRSLERWEDTRSEQGGAFHSRRLSSTLEGASFNNEGSPKIVEVDPGRPRSRGGGGGRRSDSAEDVQAAQPLPLARLSIPAPQVDSEWCLTGDEFRFSTAQSTPRMMPTTPAKSTCGCGSNGRYHNYMANTQSFRAKVRSQSAPKQRPEPRRRMSLSEMVESRASLSGVGMQRTCSRAQEAVSFKNAIVGRLDRSAELHHQYQGDYYLQKRW